jgi:hypothetical protein
MAARQTYKPSFLNERVATISYLDTLQVHAWQFRDSVPYDVALQAADIYNSGSLSLGQKFELICAISNPRNALMALTYNIGDRDVEVSYDNVPHIISFLDAISHRPSIDFGAARQVSKHLSPNILLSIFHTHISVDYTIAPVTISGTHVKVFLAHFPEMLTSGDVTRSTYMLSILLAYFGSNRHVGIKYIKNIGLNNIAEYFNSEIYDEIIGLEGDDLLNKIGEEYGMLKFNSEYVCDYILNHPKPRTDRTEKELTRKLKILFPFRTHQEFMDKLDILVGKTPGITIFRPLSAGYAKFAYHNKPSYFMGSVSRVDELGMTIPELIKSNAAVAIGTTKEYGIYGYSTLLSAWSAVDAAIKPWQISSDNPEVLDNNLLELLYHMIVLDESANIVPADGVWARNELKTFIRRRIAINVRDEDINNDWLGTFKSLLEEEKDQVVEFFKLYLTWGLYMRGWTGNSEQLPILFDQTDPQSIISTKEQKSDIAAEKVTILHEKLDASPSNVRRMFENAPLYDHGDRRWIKFPNTIMEDIIRIGRNDSVSACIRMSSHKVVATAYYYLNLMEAADWYRFDINQLAFIT